MITSTQGTLHRRMKQFVAWIAPTEEQLDKLKSRGDEIQSRVENKVTEKDYSYSTRKAGSYAKNTGLRRYMHGGDPDEGQEGLDMDIVFILNPPAGTKEADLDCKIPEFTKFLKDSYPLSEVTETKSAATIYLSGTKLSFDVVPMWKIGENRQFLKRKKEPHTRTSVQKHVEFITSRNTKANGMAGVVSFNQCVRLMKWWRFVRQIDSRNFGNGEDDEQVPSFLIDLLCAKAFDECGVEKTYADTLARWFGFLANLVANRKTVHFTDFSSTSPNTQGSLWYVADPMDANNNVVGAWNEAKLDELADWMKNSRTWINQALRMDSEKDDSGVLANMVKLMGKPFKNNTEITENE